MPDDWGRNTYTHTQNTAQYSLLLTAVPNISELDNIAKRTQWCFCKATLNTLYCYQLRGGADKSLARTERKQTTATKLGIYSTYSPRSSIHFSECCSNFRKPLKKKKFRRLSVQPGLRGSNDLLFGRKIATFQLFFRSTEQMVVRQGLIRRIGWVIKILEAQVGQFLLGCRCPVSRGIVVQTQDPLGDLLVAFFLRNVLQWRQQRWVILHVDSLALWMIINEVTVLIPKNRGKKFYSGFLHSEFFGTGWVAMPPLHWLLLCLRVIVIWSSFVHGHQSRQKNIWIAPKKIPKFAQTTGTDDVLNRVQAFRDPLRGELLHVQIFMNDGSNPLTWNAQLLSYWFSRNPAVFHV